MRIHKLLALGLTATSFLGLAVPTLAKPVVTENKPVVTEKKNPTYIRAMIKDNDQRDQTRINQSWYNAQLRRYDRIDPETGERLSDVLQMVIDVSNDRIVVMDQTDLRRVITVNRRTQILQPVTPYDRDEPYGLAKKSPGYPNTALTTVLREGDLVVITGYLRGSGGMVAQTIRLIERTNGYDDGYGRDDDYQAYGDQSWGEIRDIDTRRGTLELRGGSGPSVVRFDRDCDVVLDGDRVSTASLRVGDRVVVYFSGRVANNTVTADRIVVLRQGDRYPTDDRDGRVSTGPVVEGRLAWLAKGLMFDKLSLRATSGKEYAIYTSHGMRAIDRDGDRVELSDLRDGEHLRITYNEIGGELFATRIEIE